MDRLATLQDIGRSIDELTRVIDEQDPDLASLFLENWKNYLDAASRGVGLGNLASTRQVEELTGFHVKRMNEYINFLIERQKQKPKSRSNILYISGRRRSCKNSCR